MWAVWLMFWFSVLPEVVLIGADLGLIGQSSWRNLAYENGGFWIGLLRGWSPNYAAQPYVMFVSYGFLHSGTVHLLVNMMALWTLSGLILSRVGQSGFLALYLFSLLGGAVGFSIMSDSVQPMVGASGALFGLTGAIAAWELSDRRAENLALWPVAGLIAALAGLNLVMWWALDGQLAWQTHVAGFVAGWAAALLVGGRSRVVSP